MIIQLLRFSGFSLYPLSFFLSFNVTLPPRHVTIFSKNSHSKTTPPPFVSQVLQPAAYGFLVLSEPGGREGGGSYEDKIFAKKSTKVLKVLKKYMEQTNY